MAIAWSNSRIDTFQRCKRRYYYGYIVHEKKESIIPEFIKGRILHNIANSTKINKRTSFFKHDNGNLVPRFKSPESFGEAMRGRWMYATKEPFYQGQKILWRLEKQRYTMEWEVKDAAINLYKYFLEYGPAKESEFSLKKIRLNDIWFTGHIDEIREDHTIVDHKSSKSLDEMVLNHDPQLTIYALGYITNAIHNPNFQNKLKINKSTIKRWSQDPIAALEELNLKYNVLGSGEVISVKRTETHIKELVNLIHEIREELYYGNFAPNIGFHCNQCPHKIVCDKDLSESEGTFEVRDQLPLYVQRPKPLEVIAENLSLQF